MLTCQSDKFSIPDDITYLNCAYMGPTPKAAEAAGIRSLSEKSTPWKISVTDFFEPVKQVKSLFAQIINLDDPERVAIIPSVSHGVASVVKNIHPKPGQNIVMLEEQFPSNFYSWKRLADESGAEIRIVGAPGTLNRRGEKWNDELLQNIDNQTIAVTLPHVHWADGTLFDLAAIRQRSREVGALMILDGTQSVGALPFDVAELQPDAVICGAYKWLMGPYTSGLAYFGEAFDGGVPIEENWINRLGSENFQQLVNYQPLYKPGANRYGMGQSSQFIASAMLNVTMKMILDWGIENIQNYCGNIAQPSIDKLSDLGTWVEDADWRGKHLFGLRLPEGVELEKLKSMANAENIFVSFRGNAVRVAPQVYNEEKDLEKLVGVIRSCL